MTEEASAPWRLVCRLCSEESDVVDPGKREERRRIALAFLAKHERCLYQESVDSSSREKP